VKDEKKDKKPGWKELPIGDILEPGTARHFITGGWRTEKPVWDQKKCIHCMACWIACPDAAINVKDGKVTGINYEHCKGCGICAKECPAKIKAITMEVEKK
jgi:pyruvate ferredoxin oxidoreductase delta subunit